MARANMVLYKSKKPKGFVMFIDGIKTIKELAQVLFWREGVKFTSDVNFGGSRTLTSFSKEEKEEMSKVLAELDRPYRDHGRLSPV